MSLEETFTYRAIRCLGRRHSQPATIEPAHKLGRYFDEVRLKGELMLVLNNMPSGFRDVLKRPIVAADLDEGKKFSDVGALVYKRRKDEITPQRYKTLVTNRIKRDLYGSISEMTGIARKDLVAANTLATYLPTPLSREILQNELNELLKAVLLEALPDSIFGPSRTLIEVNRWIKARCFTYL